MQISIHSLRMEGDFKFSSIIKSIAISIHSLRMEGDYILCIRFSILLNFNPLPPHGGRRHFKFHALNCFQISIHSLRMEGDSIVYTGCSPSNISIHSLRMEGDLLLRSQLADLVLFQSTPSAWRETMKAYMEKMGVSFQSTPSAWRETCPYSLIAHLICYFNPLPPHGGRLNLGHYQNFNTFHFNPLPPHGGRLFQRYTGIIDFFISIHSLRMEGDGIL